MEEHTIALKLDTEYDGNDFNKIKSLIVECLYYKNDGTICEWCRDRLILLIHKDKMELVKDAMYAIISFTEMTKDEYNHHHYGVPMPAPIDPELQALLDEEEEIERQAREGK
jgi:hypothetical protein